MKAMYSFVMNLQKDDRIRRYSIRTTHEGWEVREEEDSEVVRHTCYQDWHRVERARLSINLKANVLREDGWREV